MGGARLDGDVFVVVAMPVVGWWRYFVVVWCRCCWWRRRGRRGQAPRGSRRSSGDRHGSSIAASRGAGGGRRRRCRGQTHRGGGRSWRPRCRGIAHRTRDVVPFPPVDGWCAWWQRHRRPGGGRLETPLTVVAASAAAAAAATQQRSTRCRCLGGALAVCFGEPPARGWRRAWWRARWPRRRRRQRIWGRARRCRPRAVRGRQPPVRRGRRQLPPRPALLFGPRPSACCRLARCNGGGRGCGGRRHSCCDGHRHCRHRCLAAAAAAPAPVAHTACAAAPVRVPRQRRWRRVAARHDAAVGGADAVGAFAARHDVAVGGGCGGCDRTAGRRRVGDHLAGRGRGSRRRYLSLGWTVVALGSG